MTQYILVPLDGSGRAEEAIPLHTRLARLTSSGIVLLRVVPPQVTTPRLISRVAEGAPTLLEAGEAERLRARDYLRILSRRIEEVGLPVRTELAEGLPAAAILEYASQDPLVWLIAMSTRQRERPRPWASGSVIEQVSRSASRPVLLVPPTTLEEGQPTTPDPAFHTIMVPLDSSRFAEEALDEAGRLARLAGAMLVLVSVVPPCDNEEIAEVEYFRVSSEVARRNETARLGRYLAGVAEQLRSQGLQVHTELVHGHPAEMVLLTARRLHVDLIVMAAHSRRDNERLWLGSTGQKLAQGSTLPLLLVRAAGRIEREDSSIRRLAAGWAASSTMHGSP